MASYIVDRDFDAELCNGSLRVDQITAFLVVWMRKHFKKAANLPEESLSRKLWAETEARGGVVIEDLGLWDSTKAGKRPAVLAHRRAYRYSKLVIADQMIGGVELTGTRYYTKMAEGVHTVACVSTSHREAELYGVEVSRELNWFSPKIKENFGFHKFEVGELGDLMKPNSNQNEYGLHWAVQIRLDIAFQETWKIIPQAPLLKVVDLETETV